MKKIYSPLLEGLLALYLGFEWIQVEKLPHFGSLHLSLITFVNWVMWWIYRRIIFSHLWSRMGYILLLYWGMDSAKFMITGVSFVKGSSKYGWKRRTTICRPKRNIFDMARKDEPEAFCSYQQGTFVCWNSNWRSRKRWSNEAGCSNLSATLAIITTVNKK